MGENLLTEKELKNAKPDPKKDTYLIDGGGLYGRVLKGHTSRDKLIVFQYRYKVAGEPIIVHCGSYPHTRLADVRKARNAARDLRNQGLNPNIEKKRLAAERESQAQAKSLEKTVQGLFDDWHQRYLKRERKDGGALVKQFMDSDVIARIGSMRAKDVTKRHISDLIDQIVDRGSKRKANSVLAMVKQMFKYGLAKGYLDIDPTFGLNKEHAGGREEPRKRNLSPDEITDLGKRIPSANLPTKVEAALWLLLGTGARVGEELTKAYWTEFDLNGRTWTIPSERSKNGKPHIVHLSDFTIRWLEKLKRHDGEELLFEGRQPGKPMSDKWIGKCIRDRQRIKPLKNRTKKNNALLLTGGEWRAHDLRRSMASRMGDLGVAPHIIEKCLNHSLEGILAVYQHQEYLPERKAAFEKWGAWLEKLAPTTGTNADAIPQNA